MSEVNQSQPNVIKVDLTGSSESSYDPKPNLDMNSEPKEPPPSEPAQQELPKAAYAPTAEEKANVEAADPEKDDFAAKFAALSRREKQLWQKEQELKNKYAGLEEQKGVLDKLKENPLEVLEKYGWDYQKLTDFVLNDQAPTENMQLEALQKKIEMLEQERQRERDQQEEQRLQQVVQEYKNDIRANTKDNDLFQAFGDEAVDLVYDVIYQHYVDSDGEIMPIEKAVKKVEDYIVGRVEPFVKLDRFRKAFGASEQPKPQAEQPSPQVTQERVVSQTLTNAATPTSGVDKGYLSDEESKRAAVAYLKKMLSENSA